MAFKIDFGPEAVSEWHRTPSGLEERRNAAYTPTIYVEGSADEYAALEAWTRECPDVIEVSYAERFTRLEASTRTELQAIHLAHTTDPRAFAGRVRREVELSRWAPGTLRFYNVDFAPQFRYCLETGTDPTPTGELRSIAIGLDEKALADRDVSTATIDGEPIDGGEPAVLTSLAERLTDVDPDVLIVRSGALIPLLAERALAHGVDLQLGRSPGWTRLAGTNTYESYGKVGHSAARYDVPGRALIDTSNSFLWAESSLAGLEYLVEQSHKPLQETAWGSIGNILTSMQIREAHDRDVVVPWNKWDPEAFKDVTTLHAADRGGFIMDPTVGLHEGVHELDFSSLYPYIMCEYNISPDTILCDCHADRDDIPGIGYNVCDERGFIADVLSPLLADREGEKETIRNAGPDEDVRDARAIAGAIKWILVSCFGYQGYRNSKFGRIECHEAINAVARDIFLRSKETLEENGWTVVHGIVDSIWVTPTPDRSQTPLEDLIGTITADVGIKLDYEATYDWVMFVPRRGSDRGALTKYVARHPDGGFKLRGIEARQRSTPPFVVDVQKDLLETLDRERQPDVVVDRAVGHVRALRHGDIDPDDLVIKQRVSKPRAEYRQATRNVAALTRSTRLDVPKHPGESVRYVVVDDDADGAERVRLAFEAVDTYDAAFYEELVWRATESVVSPLGWDRTDIDRYRRETVDARLGAFAD